MGANKHIWTDEETQYVLDNYYTVSMDELKTNLGLSRQQIYDRAYKFGLTKPLWTEEQKQFVDENFERLTYAQIGELIGKDEPAVRNYCYLHNLTKIRRWTEEEISLVKQWYENNASHELNYLSKLLNRTSAEISRLAQQLNLTNINHLKSENQIKIMVKNGKIQYEELGYRGGLKGKQHKPETIELLRQRSLELFKNDDIKKKHSKALSKALKKAIRNGYKPGGESNPYSRTKSGRREDLDKFFRSSWEANYARYLNWLISLNQIQKWEYETDIFEFHKIRKGTRFYTPDFKVWENDGSIVYHEVKGWMDDKSKTKLKRMTKYYPEVKLILIDQKAYYAIAKEVKNIIPNWE